RGTQTGRGGGAITDGRRAAHSGPSRAGRSTMSGHRCDRREFLKTTAVAAGASALPLLAPGALRSAGTKPTAPVGIARRRGYAAGTVLPALRTMLDQLGGLGKLVAGRTVAVKVNLTGHPKREALGLPASRTYQTHPAVVLALATLLDRA